MNSIPVHKQPHAGEEETLSLIRRYLAERGAPPELELDDEELDDLTEDEQRELIEDCEAIWEGRHKGTVSWDALKAELKL